ncbi:MAG: hypothetical protein EA404_14295 [Spirochaetaceae bacterium]|nr:MAG: hypothetical protein EA404_14295 [Spirochaetaceae bacterium]
MKTTRHTRPILLLSLLFLFVASPPPAAAFEQWRRRYDERTLQAADAADAADAAESVDYAALIETPTEIRFDIRDPASDADEDVVVESFADLHAVYPLNFEALCDVILDLDSHNSFVPNLVKSDVISAADDPPSWRRAARIERSVAVFSADYGFETEHIIVHQTDDEIAVIFRMVESHDEMLADTGGSWYLKRIDIDGREYTYVRHFNHVAFGSHTPGLRLALRNFGLRDIKSVMDAYYQEADARTR